METFNNHFPNESSQPHHYPLAADSTGFGDPDWTRWLDGADKTISAASDPDEDIRNGL